jgi:hypothetical protein
MDTPTILIAAAYERDQHAALRPTKRREAMMHQLALQIA